MRTHIGIGIAALLLAATSAEAQGNRGRTIRRGGMHAPVTSPNYHELLEFWAAQYGFRQDPSPAAQDAGPADPFVVEMLAKAPKDECFIDIGQHTPILPPDCPGGAIEKANEMYLWGMAIQDLDSAAGPDQEVLWMGTGANTPCLANGSLGGLVEPSHDGVLACEYGESRLVEQIIIWPGGLGDMRPSRMLRAVVDAGTGDVDIEDLSPKVDFIGDFHRFTCAGIRAVGVCDNVVLFAGPALVPTGAINMWAFRTDGIYLGSFGFADWANVRKFITVDGEMYVGVLNSLLNPNPGGSILRWTGSETNPFAFEVVGLLNNEVAELTVHEETTAFGTQKTLIAGTWPRLYGPLNQTNEYYGLFESPPLPLSATDYQSWAQLFNIADYEPDPVTARAIASGGIASWNGEIWFGSLITVGLPVLAWIESYGIPFTEEKINEVVLGTYRPLTIFRGRKVEAVGGGTDFDVDVIYGSPELPVYSFFAGSFTPTPNLIGPPLEGLGGINQMFNTYTWDMKVGKDDLLYVGTLDNSFTLSGVVISPDQPFEATQFLGTRDWGADLWVFGASSLEARSVTTRGFDNDTNSGIRNLAAGFTGMYAGTGNVSNITPEGGWELHRVISPLLPVNDD